MKVCSWTRLLILTLFFAISTAVIRPPPTSGCSNLIKNYGCHCPTSNGRVVPFKCTSMFDEEILNSSSGFPAPTVLSFPNVSPDLDPIEVDASKICVQEKYCEIRVKPSDPKWAIIDWCVTTESSALQHLQLLGPPHSPVCCDTSDDLKYVRTMMCMRRDLSLNRIIDSPLLISIYIKLLPRAVIPLRLSLVFFDKVSSSGIIPPEFIDKTNTGGASVKLVRVEGMRLDLSSVTIWADL
ncbi:unnamed protein product [Orchesella dallaii]|uniref:Uncharacterized protein n=1 Tax=Orchesella dallaii TaxID=48710 RepID=A0ABP1QKU9_9HEXA